MGKNKKKRNAKSKKSVDSTVETEIEEVTQASDTESTNTLSKEDSELLELAKMLVQEGDKELASLIKKLAEKAEEEHKVILKDKEDNFKKELDEKYAEKLAEKESLEKKISELKAKEDEFEQERTKIECEKKNLEVERTKILDNAEKDAKSRLDQVYKEEKKKFEKAQEDLKTQQAEFSAKKEELEKQKEENAKTLAQERKELVKEKKEFEEEKEDALEALKNKEEKLKKKEEEYDKANPVKLGELEAQIKNLNESISRWKDECGKLSAQKTELELTKAKASGYTIEELQQERDRLSGELDDLRDKFSEYDDLTLKEMKAALEEKPELESQIIQLKSEVANREHELIRRENVQLEYEQLKEQLSLLRTLNDNLRTELSTTKKMLESSTGDVCPALTQIDVNAESEIEKRNDKEREESKSENETLYSIVHHIIDYAASQKKPLFYSESDVKAFVAGLAASHFAILQGMSGTGKTSLPRIFAEAILGEVNIVPVESSWRDRNELLGYYNDFSKKYTAKEFTCALYKANTQFYTRVPYFIVLDEMNLSRVEYYFADFLSVLENAFEDWKVDLVDIDMRQLPNEITKEVRDALEKDESARIKELKEIVDKMYDEKSNKLKDESVLNAGEKQKLLQYLSEKKIKNSHGTSSLIAGPQKLEAGKTIRIPENVWFIGTANKDESTFEITDKVYDRAQVLNFRERAKGKKLDKSVERKFITNGLLKTLFYKAANNFKFDCENHDAIKEIDKYLKEHFNVSFGNRILDQINKFVPVYVASSFAQNSQNLEREKFINEALDYQITNKVLRKLEYVDMSSEQITELEEIFEKYKFEKALAFLNLKKEN